MAVRRRAHAPFDHRQTSMVDRQNIDEVDEFELMFDAADIDTNPAATDV